MKRKNQIRKVVGILIFGILGIVIGYAIGKMAATGASSSALPAWVKIALIGVLIPAFFVAIAIHEAGHAVAGRAVGFDFRMYVVGPFMWEKDMAGWHFKWNKNVNTAGGMVMCLPMDTVNLPKRFSIFAAGGPLASLILAILAYVIYGFGFKDSPKIDITKEILGSFFLFTAFISLFIFMATSIPIHVGGFYTDGARIIRLLRGGDKAQFDSLILKVVTQSTSGIRPKLLDTNEIKEALEIGQRIEEPFRVYLYSYLYQAAFDMGDIELAEKYLLDYINEADNIPDGIRNVVWLDAAFFYAFAKNDLVKAEAYWNQYKAAPTIPKAQVLATEAVIDFLKNDIKSTLRKIELAQKEIPNMIDKGVGIALAEKLGDLKSRIP